MRRRGPALFCLLAVAFSVCFLFLLDPTGSSFFPRCPFRALTGLECPGCGSTRAVHHLLHGDLVAGLKLNPLLLVCAPFAGYLLSSTGLTLLRGRGLPNAPVRPAIVWLVLGTIVAFWVYRNTPYYPFGS